MQARFDDDQLINRAIELPEEHPATIAKTIAKVPAPPKDTLIERRKNFSRM